MSKSIDNRIVEMRFDNQQFENGVKTSVKSLDELKKSLDLEGSTRSLQGFALAAKGVSLEHLSKQVDMMASRFSVLGIMGVAALQNITNAAMESGRSIIKSLTVDPIKTGLNEYEIKMNAIRTILANTKDQGATLENVNDVLQKLNDYSDKTIYNFGQMTDMVGKFAAKSGDLYSSASMVQGLANLAAVSGVDNARLQGALYQVSQISEVVKSLDWSSLDNAGMGTKKFKDDLIEMAKAMGTIDLKTIKDIESGVVSFRDTLQNGWLTKDVFTAVTNMYAADEEMTRLAGEVTTFTKLLNVMQESVQSGWAQTWEAIIGTQAQSTALFTGISNMFADMIGPATKARIAMFEFWNEYGGRTAVIEGMVSAVQILQKVLAPISEAFHNVFPPMTGQMLVDISKKFRDLTASFKMGEGTYNNIRRSFQGLFSAFHLGFQIVKALTVGVTAFVKAILPAGGGLLSVTATLGDFITGLDQAVERVGIFSTTFAGIGTVLGSLASHIKSIIGKILDVIVAFAVILGPTTEKIAKDLTTAFKVFSSKDFSEGAKVIDNFKIALEGPLTKLTSMFDAFCKSTEGLRNNIRDVFASMTLEKFLDIVKVGASSGGLLMIAKGLYNFFTKSGNFMESLVGVLNGVKGALKAYQEQLKARALLQIAQAVGILAVSLLVLSKIKTEDIGPALLAITGLFTNLLGGMALFEKFGGVTGSTSLIMMTGSLILVSAAVLLLSKALKDVSSLSWEEMARGLVAISVLTFAMIKLAEKLSATDGKLIKSSIGLNAFAVAINLLVNVIERIGKLDTKVLIQGFIGLTGVVIQLVAFLRIVGDKSTFNASAGIGLIGLALAITALYYAMSLFATMKLEELGQGLWSLGLVLASLAIFVKTTEGATGIFGIAAGLVLLAGSMFVFAAAIKVLGTTPIEQLTIGILAMAAILTVLSIALDNLPADSLMGSAALLVAATAIVIIARAFMLFNMIPGEGIAKSLIALGGALTFLVIGLNLMRKALPGAIVLGVAAAAMMLLAPAILALGSLPIEAVGIALLALAGIFAVLGLATFVLMPIIPAMVALGIAIAALGLGLAAVGLSVGLFAAGLATLMALGDEGMTTFKKLLALIPEGMKAIASGLMEFIKVILTGIATNAPLFIKGALMLIGDFMDAVAQALPWMMEKGCDLGVNLLNGIQTTLPRMIKAGLDLIIAFIDGLANGIRNDGPRLLGAIANLMMSLITIVWDTLVSLDTKFREAAGNVVQGFIEGIQAKFLEIAKVGTNMGLAALNALKKALGIHSPSKETTLAGKYTGEGFVNGIKSYNSASVETMKKLTVGAIEAVKPKVEKVAEGTGVATSEKFAKGIKKGGAAAKKSAKEMAEEAAEAAKKAFAASSSWIDDRKYYNEIALNDELAAWERVQARYTEGTDERKKADREVYRVKKELETENKRFTDAALQIETAANEKRIQMELEYADKTKEINDRLKADIKSVTDAYEDAVESRTDALYSAYGLFDAVETKDPVDGQALIDNLQGQVDAFDSWRRDMDSLANRGVSDKLISELEKLGPSSAAELQALTRMSDEQLSQYESLWAQKYQGARSQALEELEGMRQDSMNQIATLRSEAEVELKEYITDWSLRMEELRKNTAGDLDKLKADWIAKIGEIKTESDKQTAAMADKMVENVMRPDWSALGQSVVDGIRRGIASRAEVLLTEVGNLAQSTMNRYASVQNSNSPSKEFAKLGRYAVEGLVLGFRRHADNAANAAQKVGEGTISAFSKAIGTVATLLSTELDNAPVIRPVLDLSEIQSGMGNMNSMLSTDKTVKFAAATSVDGQKSQNGSESQKEAATPATSVQLVQNNYSPKALSRLEIYRQTKNQISTLKGVVAGL